MKSLHPNLARIAAEYDEIVLQAQMGHMTAEQANARISKLVAKDDQGLDWVINPLTGNWSYRNSRGELVEASPPEYGFASPTPKDMGSSSTRDFDARLSFHEVNEASLNTDSVLGATRREINSKRKRSSSGLLIGICFIIALAVYIALTV